jgi:gas vesicle protein
MVDEVREAAKKELKRREWASKRGKATRAYLREHPELSEQYEKTSTIKVGKLPEYVTKSSLLIELGRRASDKETRRAVREWKEANPEEAERLQAELAKKEASSE